MVNNLYKINNKKRNVIEDKYVGLKRKIEIVLGMIMEYYIFITF